MTDYAACVGDLNGASTAPNWFSTLANGAIVIATVASTPAQGAGTLNTPIPTFTSNTRISAISDGTSNTFLIGEKHVPQGAQGRLKAGDGPAYSGAWTAYVGRLAGIEDPLARGPNDLTQSTSGDGFWARKFGSWHAGVVNFVYVDGSVRGVRNTIDTTNLRRLAVRNDGQVINSID